MGIADEAALYALGCWVHENHPVRIDAVCLNTIQKKMPCDACAAACPAHVDVCAQHIDWHACMDCGLCATACPTQAINASAASSARIDAAVEERGACASFACARYRGHADATLSCLAAFGWDELAAYALHAPVVLKTAPCKDCPDEARRAQVKELLARLRFFFGPDGFSRRVLPRAVGVSADRGGARGAGARRRHALASAAESVKGAAARLLDSEAGEPASSRSRVRLLTAIEGLPEEQRPVLHWKTLVEDGRCKGCGICVRMCPHGALSFSFDDACALDGTAPIAADDAAAHGGLPHAPSEQTLVPRFLVHDASLCTQCGLCYMSCPEDNLGGWEDAPSASVPVTVAHVLDLARCEKCGRTFRAQPGRTRCPSCSRFRFAPSAKGPARG
ncbi:MAG: 4Fe-4S binding protein [Slackia sp.]|nr:4Fe-4S binding protein [Slackia sp.]